MMLCGKLWQPLWNPICTQQIRTVTQVVYRRRTAPLVRVGEEGIREPKLRRKHKVYQTIQNNVYKTADLTIRLIKNVEGVGRTGEVVSMNEYQARFLILTKAADYLSGDSDDVVLEDVDAYSSKYAQETQRKLRDTNLQISMSKDNPWTLEHWHIRSAFRKAGIWVPDGCFTMPPQTISGPDLSLEGKEFFIEVTINNREKAWVRCRIHHWATEEDDRLPAIRDHWKQPREPLTPRDAEIAKTMPELVAPVYPEHEDTREFQEKIMKNKQKRQGKRWYRWNQ